jgi:hypothetical protein
MKKLILLLIAGAAVASIWSWTRSEPPVEPARKVLADRLWIDRLPRGDKDTINVFVMVSERSAGVFQAASQWRGAYEVFRYEAQGGELRLLYPQTGDREKVRVKLRECDENGMDFCLELDGASRGVKKYYSREEWEIGGAHNIEDVKQRIEAMRAQLPAAE